MGQDVILGLDIGGTGIKGALVDIKKGRLVSEKYRELTPRPSTPPAVTKTVMRIINEQFGDYEGPIGVGFPSIIKNHTALTAANIDKEWIGVHVKKLFEKADDRKHHFYIANDADLAGLAEMRFGDAKGTPGKVIVLTIGTGIGSALFLDQKLVPNVELGHVNYKNESYEKYVSNFARKNEGLKWNEWGMRFSDYLIHLELLFSPDLFVLGGGACKKFDKFSDYLSNRTKVIPATFLNDAGVIGAAMFAKERRALV